MLSNLTEISVDMILNQVHRKKDEGYRFVSMTTVENEDLTIDLYYHFDRDYEISNLKLTVNKEFELPSISKIYLAAVFVENEIQELFGVKFDGKAINYGGHFILSDDDLENPMCRNQIVIEQLEDK
ncbi:MAG: NADH-quinone oxidoreductase subunit C [Bacillota bacterium]